MSATLIVACASNAYQLSDDGRKVEILKRKPKSGGDCEVVEKVSATHDEGSADLAKNKARNIVADKGGDSIYFDDVISNGKKRQVLATGYKCN